MTKKDLYPFTLLLFLLAAWTAMEIGKKTEINSVNLAGLTTHEQHSNFN